MRQRLAWIGVLCMLAVTVAGANATEKKVRINRVIELWEQGEPAIGMLPRDFSFDQALWLSTTPFDFLMCENEHLPLDFSGLRQFLYGLLDRKQILEMGNSQMRPTPLVRIPAYGREHNQWMAKQMLDIGFAGVIFPHISTPEQAESAVRACRYPQPEKSAYVNPPGQRGTAPDNGARYWGLSEEEYVKRADVWPLNPEGEILAVMLVEDREGAENIEGIARVQGVGAILIGPLDLSFSLGVPMQPGHPRVEAMIQHILAQTKKAGLPCGIFVGTPTKMMERLRQGFRFVSTAGPGFDDEVLREAHAISPSF